MRKLSGSEINVLWIWYQCVMDVISMCYVCDINVLWTLCDMFDTLWETLRHLDALRDTILETPDILDTATRDAYAFKNVEAMLRCALLNLCRWRLSPV